ncbi:MAG: DUF6794 domain-containing protein [Chlorobium sp.]
MQNKSHWPKTIKDAAERVISKMSEEEKQVLRRTQPEELARFQFGLGVLIRNKCGLNGGNAALMKACALSQQQADTYNIFYQDDPESASEVIIEAVWKHLRSAA